MENQYDSTRLDSPAWVFFVKVSFACALGGMLFGIVMMGEVPIWMRGYLVLGTLFLTGATFTLAKTLRDQFEAGKLINQLAQARTEKLLKEYGVER
ncbi:YiaA/YiaB family inner membrane protein [Sinimarinibacterium thermocellulolyticum]|uniref:YiaA/YiaB family inner membrane protein n=1 Tax=Sinimarinibacterium thermocellulolyticum TaxID=3170016 RepID=A0ABV2A9K5_9GAMM